MEKLNEVAAFVERNPGLADCVVQIAYSEMYDIAEAFRDLAQRAEAAEEKLAELERQEPVAYTDAEELETMRKGTFADMFTPCDEYKSDPLWIPLFTRPAPAADLAELVPDEIPRVWNGTRFTYVKDSVRYAANYANGHNACRAAMLRRIEESGKC